MKRMAELEKRVLSDINMDHEALNNGVKHLTEWLTKQPHLPNVTDEQLLKTFIIGSKSVERAKEKLVKYFLARSKHTAIYEKRDPLSIKWNNFEEILFLPNKTEDDCNIFLMTTPLSKERLDSLDVTEATRAIFMLFDYMFRHQPFVSGQYVLLDCSGVNLEFFVKFMSIMTVTAFDIYQDCLPIRMKAFVCFNASPTFEKLNTLIKKFIGPKLKDRVYFHSGDHTVLANYFSLDCLPEDYNGKCPSIKQIKDTLRKGMESDRDWFMNEGSLGADLKKLPTNDGNNLEEMQGTFRKLQID